MLLIEEAKNEQRKYISMIYNIAIIENDINSLFQRRQQIHQRNQQQIPSIEDDQKI